MSHFTEANRHYFDEKATHYKTDFAEATQLLISEIESRRHWISPKWTDTEGGRDQEITLLDYACGPGTVSSTLAPFVTKAVGIDVSDNMIAEFNKNAREAGVAEKMVGLKGDLLCETIADELCEPNLFNFDIVVVSLALHHFPDPEFALKRLADRLKKGGTLLIVDFVPDKHTHEFHKDHPEAAATIGKHGFTRDEVRKLCEDAGVEAAFDYQVVEKPMKFVMKGKDQQRTLFFARADCA
ncbi:S-adenosyl-L-methionine-dependent methyltransferase [Paecilomyces variotii]|uniref:S-adenosyl-L-methionine-dependent methyltransferase n=1 Tax=Byssochlamys spectabilis TaxID=264951 RepID=A0A443HXT2_BYSSP|nr:S-adenosyl-L-methionine-dependent methyltransferase [Paecilomyces variotii]KAJ9223643.1 hypothetical protein DTO169C6_3995 [Paecilomyces variotii]KAJ9301028.1 hypothetical protein DTO217A2_7804 [Paecilomyces variotii]KAJ9350876.1 hypothetical protein DTO280E4_8472 [Paecilomyces variotii]KAJ9367245.1 hypothetical protein DTO282E5_8093 [Paecilomyces variotii]KAJ9380239.1 hypothetical protein DTO063F5_6814 [Paecilomyces variotii]